MENLYELINQRIKQCEEDEKEYLTLFEEYFICHLVPTIMEEVLNNINLKNYKAYYNYESLPVDRKIEIFKIDDGIIKYDKYNLRINYKLLGFFKKVINKFLKDNNLGYISCKKDYDSNQIIINTNLGSLIKAYKIIIEKRSINGLDNYDNRIKLITASLDDIYENDVYSDFYFKFLNSLYIMIKSKIDEINVLNYEDFDSSKEIIDDYFYIRLKDKGYHALTTLDLVVTKNYEDAIKDLIKEFLNDYKVGEMRYDETYKIQINSSLADLMYAYYMEMQRLDYIGKVKESPRVLELS